LIALAWLVPAPALFVLRANSAGENVSVGYFRGRSALITRTLVEKYLAAAA
jgi:hypothetical protein